MFNFYVNYKNFIKKTGSYPVHYFTLLTLNYLVIMTVLAINLIILMTSTIDFIRVFTLFNVLILIGAYISNTQLIVSYNPISRYLIRIMISFISYSFFAFLLASTESTTVITILYALSLILCFLSFKANKIPIFRTQII